MVDELTAQGVATDSQAAIVAGRQPLPAGDDPSAAARRTRPDTSVASFRTCSGIRFPSVVIVLAVRWNLRYGLS